MQTEMLSPGRLLLTFVFLLFINGKEPGKNTEPALNKEEEQQ